MRKEFNRMKIQFYEGRIMNVRFTMYFLLLTIFVSSIYASEEGPVAV